MLPKAEGKSVPEADVKGPKVDEFQMWKFMDLTGIRKCPR